jgi:hypothetical protein
MVDLSALYGNLLHEAMIIGMIFRHNTRYKTLKFARYQADPGNADPEALPPLISQLTGERTVGSA